MRLMREVIKNKSTEELKNQMRISYQKILNKQKIIKKHKNLITQMSTNCNKLIEEYELIDRVLFFRERKVKIIPPSGTRIKKNIRISIEKNVEELSRKDAASLLEHLLTIRKSQQQSDPL